MIDKLKRDGETAVSDSVAGAGDLLIRTPGGGGKREWVSSQGQKYDLTGRGALISAPLTLVARAGEAFGLVPATPDALRQVFATGDWGRVKGACDQGCVGDWVDLWVTVLRCGHDPATLGRETGEPPSEASRGALHARSLAYGGPACSCGITHS